MDRQTAPEEATLAAEIKALRREIETLNGHRYIRVQNSLPKMMGYQLLRGLALGLGTVIGASVLVSLLAYSLSQIDFIPIVGDWAAEIAQQILAETGSDGFGGEN
jgi:hypothetical protein